MALPLGFSVTALRDPAAGGHQGCLQALLSLILPPTQHTGWCLHASQMALLEVHSAAGLHAQSVLVNNRSLWQWRRDLVSFV